MTRKISKQERAMRRFEYQVKRFSTTINRTGVSLREATDSIKRLVFAWDGKEPAWPQFNHEKEKPERSRMHAMYGRRRNK